MTLLEFQLSHLYWLCVLGQVTSHFGIQFVTLCVCVCVCEQRIMLICFLQFYFED